MNVSVIIAHPNIKSFNHAIFLETLKVLKSNNHNIFSHNLYKENFDPVMNCEELGFDRINNDLVKIHCEEIVKADGIIVIHPNWWGQPPAILKGWVDRVFRENIAYKFNEGDSGEGIPKGLLKVKTAVVFNTSNTPKEREIEVFKDPLETIWKNCIFNYCGVKNFSRRMFCVIAGSSLEQRIKWLYEVNEIVNSSFPKDI